MNISYFSFLVDYAHYWQEPNFIFRVYILCVRFEQAPIFLAGCLKIQGVLIKSLQLTLMWYPTIFRCLEGKNWISSKKVILLKCWSFNGKWRLFQWITGLSFLYLYFWKKYYASNIILSTYLREAHYFGGYIF